MGEFEFKMLGVIYYLNDFPSLSRSCGILACDSSLPLPYPVLARFRVFSGPHSYFENDYEHDDD